MNRGYVWTWRKSLDAGWLKNHKLWAFWSYCILKASYQEHDVIIGTQTVHLIPGQFIFGRKKAAEDLDLSEQEVRTILKYLEKSENLTIKSTNKFSIITIVNWNTYQGGGFEINQQINQPLTSNQPATNQPLTTYNKGNKGKKGNNSKTHLPDDFQISDAVRKWAEKNNHQNLDAHLESFKLTCLAKGYQYQSWDAAFMKAVRDNWAKIEQYQGGKSKAW